MIGTSHRAPVQRSVSRAHRQGSGKTFINSHPLLHCSHLALYIHGPDGKWLKCLFSQKTFFL
ncbi:unnamed protein product, partial [Staurois parvus]